MDKELQQTLAQVTMYSKMGRYISNKILKYNKPTKTTHRNYRTSKPESEEYIQIKKIKKRQYNDVQNTMIKNNSSMYLIKPPVGYYKVNYSQVQKNPRVYDFMRSVPHFNRDKYFCNQSKPVQIQYPQSPICQIRPKGMAQLQRMAGRQDIKGSIRQQIVDPHQNRFKKIKDSNSIQFSKTMVNMSKDLPRNNIAFKNYSTVPQYDYDIKLPLKRLDTHIIKFENILDRNNAALNCEKGISNYFDQHVQKQDSMITDWSKMLPRQKTGLLPSYMDKNINTRSSIALVNLKTLEMNCTNIHRPKQKSTRKHKNLIKFVEDQQNNKQNTGQIKI